MHRVLLAIVACSMFAPAVARADNVSADDRAGIEALGRLMVDGVNETDPVQRLATVPRVFAPSKISQVGAERLATLLTSLHQRLSPLTYHHSEVIVSSTEPGFVLHTYARAESGWKDLQMRVGLAPPFRITEFVFLADVSEPVYLPNGDISSAQTLEWLNGWIDRLVQDEDLAVSVLIAEGDRILYERTTGFADVARARPVTPATEFAMASGSKMFTAIVLGQLVESGSLAWDDPVAKYLPDWPDAEFARRCTVRQLLSHTSGLNEYWTDRFAREAGSIRTLADFVPFIVSEGVSFAPGERFEYSNSNFIVAGLIVEKMSGQDYFAAVGDRIWKPAGMNATHSGDEPGASTPLAERLTGSPHKWTLAPWVVRSSSAGGATTTARDQLAFARALQGGRLVSAKTLQVLTTASARDEGAEYGLGFELEHGGGMRSYGHGGIAPGCNFELRVFPERGITLVVLNNQDNGAYDDLRRNLVKLITGER